MTRILLKNADIIDPSQGIDGRFDLLINNGVVEAMKPKLSPEKGTETMDLSGFVLTPGFTDLHCHLREPGDEGSETIASGTRAAAAGGFTTIYAMPNTNPICDTMTGVHYISSRAAKSGCGVKVVPIASVTREQKGEDITNYGVLKKAGAGAFSDDYKPIMNAQVMRCALSYTKMLGLPIMDHCQDLNLTGDGVMHEGEVSLKLGLKGIPRVAESVMVARNVALAAATGGHIHICHVSTRESVEIIREAKRNGVHVTAEVTPHHLLMTDRDVEDYNTMAKVMPPLCAEEDRQALIAGLRDETIDCIVTDHAPHGGMSKNAVFEGAPFGVIGFESTFPILHQYFCVDGDWSLHQLVEKLTQGPAKVMKSKSGSLRPGCDADFVVMKTTDAYTFDESCLESKSKNCPFLGKTVHAKMMGTAVKGSLVWLRDDQANELLKPLPRLQKHSAENEMTDSLIESL